MRRKRRNRRNRRNRWGGTLVLVAGVVVASAGTMGVPILASNGANAETTTVIHYGNSPTISISPLDSLVLPLLDLVYPPAEPAVPQEALTPTPAPAATPPPAPSGPSGLAGSVLAAMNADRAANGLAPLVWNDHLAGIAQNWAGTIAQYGSLTHQDMNSVLAQSGFSRVGENLLYGPSGMTAADMESMWMNSPPHRAIILDPSYTAAGVGYVVGPDGLLWAVAEFGG